MKTTKTEIEIGTKFYRHYWKHKKLEEVIDIHITTNTKGEVVKVRYVTEYEMLGQKVRDYDVIPTTILRSKIIN
jgi:hypothetical protein